MNMGMETVRFRKQCALAVQATTADVSAVPRRVVIWKTLHTYKIISPSGPKKTATFSRFSVLALAVPRRLLVPRLRTAHAHWYTGVHRAPRRCNDLY